MRKFFILCLLAIPLTGICQVQDTLISRTALSVLPFHFFQNTMTVGLERFSNDRSRSHNFLVGLMIQGEKNEYETQDVGDYDGVFLEWQYRKYVLPIRTVKFKDYKQGVYAGMFLKAGAYRSKNFVSKTYNNLADEYVTYNTDYQEKIQNASLGFTIGVQRVYWNTLFIHIYAGGGMQLVDREITNVDPSVIRHRSALDPAYKGIIPKIGCSIGLGL